MLYKIFLWKIIDEDGVLLEPNAVAIRELRELNIVNGERGHDTEAAAKTALDIWLGDYSFMNNYDYTLVAVHRRL